jgi:hypothetical protein
MRVWVCPTALGFVGSMITVVQANAPMMPLLWASMATATLAVVPPRQPEAARRALLGVAGLELVLGVAAVVATLSR